MASNFPLTLDTDQTLLVANDNIQTTLSVVQQPTDTVAIVASTTGWKPYMIATVDNEQQFVTSIMGANTLQVNRNFNGTGAVSHQAGARVANFVDSAYHHALSSAIQAIQRALMGGGDAAWAQGPLFQTPDYKYYWCFNDPQKLGLYTRFGLPGGPYITAADYGDPGGGDGHGEYHYYYHDAGDARIAAIGKSFAIQSFKRVGIGSTLSAFWVDCTADGAWTPQPPAGGITNGPMAGTFSATLAHSTGKGGFACSLNTYATCNGPSAAQQLSGIEVDVVNHVIGTDGHCGVMVVDQSTAPTTQAGGDFGYGLNGQGTAPGFKNGLQFDAGGVSTNGTLFLANGSVQNGIDFSGVNFDGLILNLPGFVLGPGGNLETPLTILQAAPVSSDLTVLSNVKTSGSMLQLVHSTSAWVDGNAIAMNFGLGGGTFTGNFITCFLNSVLKFNVDSNGAMIHSLVNFVGAETGTDGAIAGRLAPDLADMPVGHEVTVKLAHRLDRGPNTFDYAETGARPIRSSRDPARDIAEGYAAGGIVHLMWNGEYWLDLSQ